MSEDFKFQASFKTKSGNLFNLRANTEEELSAELQSFANQLPAIEAIEGTIGAMETVYAVLAPERGSGGGGGGRSYGGGNRPAASAPASAPAGGGKTCGHGDMTYRTGEGKRGKWEAYFCPAPKGAPDQCQPVWL